MAKLKLQFAERQFGGSFVRLFMKFPLFSGWRILCHRGRDGSVGTAKAVLYACGHYSGTKAKNQFRTGEQRLAMLELGVAQAVRRILRLLNSPSEIFVQFLRIVLENAPRKLSRTRHWSAIGTRSAKPGVRPS